MLSLVNHKKKGTAVTVPMDWHRCKLRRPFGYIIAIHADKVKHLCRKGRCFFMAQRATREVKARYWWAVCYPENMVDDWQEIIGDKLQLPYAYCIHDKDHLAEYKPGKTAAKSVQERYADGRKAHVHIIIAYNNTTNYSTALRVFQSLSKEGASCLNTVEYVQNIRHAYEYLIHNTDTCRRQKKYRYDASERVTGNNFDIGAFEQVGTADKQGMCRELATVIYEQEFLTFRDFYGYVKDNYDNRYFEVLMTHSGLFDRLIKGNYHTWELMQRSDTYNGAVHAEERAEEQEAADNS